MIGPRHRVESEDIPEGVNTAPVGVEHMTELSLEPTAAPRTAYALLRRTAKALASSAHGAVLDLQTDTMATPTGVRRFVRSAAGEVLDALELSWFSTYEAMRSRNWLDEFLRLLERELPEALPVRYGQYEPPPYRLRELGREHLVDFLAQEYVDPSKLGFAVWYPQRPVLDVHLSLGAGPSRHGWRSHRITIGVEAAVLRQPGWATALQRIWRRIAHLTRTFYADVRTLRNQRPGGSNYLQELAADHHPVCSWFWAGIPRDGGVAVALGEPYLALWPEFEAAGERERDVVFVSQSDWSTEQDVFDRVGGVPERLAMQSSGYAPGSFGPNLNPVYPPIWPFGTTHSERS